MTNGASSNSKRRKTSRAVSSSGRIAKTRPLECGQSIAEFDPADIVTEPGMMRGRKCPWRIETAGGDVDEIRGAQVLIGQPRSAGAAKTAFHLRRGFELERRTARETK